MVDMLGSVLIVGALTSAVAILAVNGGRALDIETLTASWGFLCAAAAAGSLLVVAGGYTAGWWARRRPMAHALGAGCLSLALSIAGVLIEPGTTPFWLNASMVSLHLPLALLGGHLYARSQRWA